MFKSKTLFVVGAGASCEVDFPNGHDLKKIIAELLNITFEYMGPQRSGDYLIFKSLLEFCDGRDGIDINFMLRKAWKIRDIVPSSALSIDNFLDAHDGDECIEICGKLAILRAISNAERASKMRFTENGSITIDPDRIANTWYIKFFQLLTENVRRHEIESIFDNISIITFNYDRCIEFFLYHMLQKYYDIDHIEAKNILSKLQIYHPYGYIGALPWQTADHSIEFGSITYDLLNTAEQIKTFSEGLDDDELLAKIRECVCNSNNIVFLGFAFHPMNLSIIRPDQESYKNKQIYATAYNIYNATQLEIERDIWSMLRLPSTASYSQYNSSIYMDNSTCAIFFDHYFRSLGAAAR